MTITLKLTTVFLAATMLATPVLARRASPADAPYADYVCPEKLPTNQAVMKEMETWSLWAYNHGYKTLAQILPFRNEFLFQHECYTTLLNLERNNSADKSQPICTFTPDKGYDSCISDNEFTLAFRQFCKDRQGVLNHQQISCSIPFSNWQQYITVNPAEKDQFHAQVAQLLREHPKGFNAIVSGRPDKAGQYPVTVEFLTDPYKIAKPPYKPGDVIKVDGIARTIRAACPAQWVMGHAGLKAWFTGNYEQDGTDGTPYLIFIPDKGKVHQGNELVENIVKVCPSLSEFLLF